MVNFKDGELVKGAYVIIDGKEYEVHMPQYSGETPLSSENLNKMQKDLQDKMIEGTWTPTLTTLEDVAPTMEYSIRQGTYKKLGKLVYLSFYIRGNITALNGSENYVKITGIPYASSKTMLESILSVGGLYQMLEYETNANAFINGNIIRVQTQYGEVAGKLKVTPTSGTGYFEISASGWYETNE